MVRNALGRWLCTFVLATGCGGATTGGGGDQRLLRDLSVEEARQLCRDGVESGRRILTQCSGEVAYQSAMASCERTDFAGYNATCGVSVAKAQECASQLANAADCAAAAKMTTQESLCGPSFRNELAACVTTETGDAGTTL